MTLYQDKTATNKNKINDFMLVLIFGGVLAFFFDSSPRYCLNELDLSTDYTAVYLILITKLYHFFLEGQACFE